MPQNVKAKIVSIKDRTVALNKIENKIIQDYAKFKSNFAFILNSDRYVYLQVENPTSDGNNSGLDNIFNENHKKRLLALQSDLRTADKKLMSYRDHNK